MSQAPLELELTLGDVAHGGLTVARHEGRVVFVRHGAPGERVRVAVATPGEKDRFWRADVIEVLEASEHRGKHPWAAADALAARTPDEIPGGAEFGHLELSYQRELKGRVLAEQLRRLAKLDVADLGFDGVEAAEDERADGLGWRTRAAFGVDRSGSLAMRAARSHTLVKTPVFPLAADAINELALGEVDLSGLGRVEIAAPAAGGAPLVLLVPAAPDAAGVRRAGAAANRVSRHVGERASVGLLTQADGAASDGAGELRRVSGRTWLREEVDGRSFRVSGEGFWQVHRSAPQTLTHAVMAAAGVEEGQDWLDLYAGAGLFSAPLAEAVGPTGSLLSIEGAPGTHRDARKNLHALPQAQVLQGRVERSLREHAGTRPNGVVLDPPRAGAGKAGVAAIAATGTESVVYVSCDPASFARDVDLFAGRGYALRSVRGFDLYPHTHHLETVAVLRRA
ncbi:MAG: class I SAM-dependent RNA methyltransferase [Arthrobacter sp.]|jgi:tRNA/tmRNA/rRNA uracil-C5-methylase (TrmA/RlmC/RlmD family)|nr:class I SAM-dependent RNA methyltransferase [Arthrobacter sp.]